MCLFIGNVEGYVLEKDLVVYKQIIGNEKEGYRTPVQDWPVKLDSMLVPDEKEPEITAYGYKWRVSSGVIHAFLKTITVENNFYEAIIPKGTRVWIQDDLWEIAAEKLYLTSEKQIEPAESDLSEFIQKFASDVLLSGGERKQIIDNPDPADVIGICLKSSECIVSLSFYEKQQFSKNVLINYTGKLFSNPKEASSDSNGKKNTENLKNCSNFESISALSFCKSIEYLPSINELREAFTELLQINLSRRFLGLDPLPLSWYYWSSSVKDKETVWLSYSCGDKDDFYRHTDLTSYGHILPFIDISKI